MSTTSKRPFWIGVADVVPVSGSRALGDASGAFVGVAGLSESKAAFRDLVARSLVTMGFQLFDLEDEELIESAAQESSMDAELLTKAHALTVERPLVFGTFHAYHGGEPS